MSGVADVETTNGTITVIPQMTAAGLGGAAAVDIDYRDVFT